MLIEELIGLGVMFVAIRSDDWFGLMSYVCGGACGARVTFFIYKKK